MPAKIGREATSCNSADSSADFLKCGHQWVEEEHRPKHSISEVRSHLGIGCNSTRIVIGRSRNQPRPKLSKNVFYRGAFQLIRLLVCDSRTRSLWARMSIGSTSHSEKPSVRSDRTARGMFIREKPSRRSNQFSNLVGHCGQGNFRAVGLTPS